MKKRILTIIGMLAIFLILSFANLNSENQTLITISSEHPIAFDMSQNGVTTNGLMTPYEFKFNKERGKFIFKIQ